MESAGDDTGVALQPNAIPGAHPARRAGGGTAGTEPQGGEGQTDGLSTDRALSKPGAGSRFLRNCCCWRIVLTSLEIPRSKLMLRVL